MDIVRSFFAFLRISASDYEDISLKALSATELSAGRMKQGLILFLQVQFFQDSAQNPDLPLDCLIGALDRQEYHLSFASCCWRAGLEGNSTVNELLCMKSQLPLTGLDFHQLIFLQELASLGRI